MFCRLTEGTRFHEPWKNGRSEKFGVQSREVLYVRANTRCVTNDVSRPDVGETPRTNTFTRLGKSFSVSEYRKLFCRRYPRISSGVSKEADVFRLFCFTRTLSSPGVGLVTS